MWWNQLVKWFLSNLVLQAILSAQKLGLEGEVKIPGYKDCVLLTNGANMTAAQLTRLRRQFLSYTKLHPNNDIGKIGSVFVQFLNTSLRWSTQDTTFVHELYFQYSCFVRNGLKIKFIHPLNYVNQLDQPRKPQFSHVCFYVVYELWWLCVYLYELY